MGSNHRRWSGAAVALAAGMMGMAGGSDLAAQDAGAVDVDDAVLAAASADGEWLTYGGDYAETHYSSLHEITRETVDRLGLAWSVEVGSDGGRLESTPLVSNGVLYATTTWDVVVAVDLRTRSVKWRWDPQIAQATLPPVEPPSIGYIAPPGEPGFLVAWDPVTQQARWRVPYRTRENGGTLATAGTLVFAGPATGDFSAHDAETGNVLWTTDVYQSVATPVTYEIDGRQYVAVLSGTFGNNPPGRLFVFALGGTEPVPGR